MWLITDVSFYMQLIFLFHLCFIYWNQFLWTIVIDQFRKNCNPPTLQVKTYSKLAVTNSKHFLNFVQRLEERYINILNFEQISLNNVLFFSLTLNMIFVAGKRKVEFASNHLLNYWCVVILSNLYSFGQIPVQV